ncbi:hypothetical protein [Amycolatopsis thermoflava]|uniref:hypothetical protein n=1 Tax=Amycolatopsis thermoflava TaxID=84480 RepID=UPI0038117F83
MAGSNMVAAKAALIDKLAAAPELAGVQISYGWPGRTLERECIYGGRIRFTNEYLAFAAAGVNDGRIPRLETATISLYVVVRAMDSDQHAADTRTVELGAVLENLLAADPRLGGIAMAAAVESGDLEPLIDDDAVAAQLTYEISVRSELT